MMKRKLTALIFFSAIAGAAVLNGIYSLLDQQWSSLGLSLIALGTAVKNIHEELGKIRSMAKEQGANNLP